jgi:PadR family transcriptional regulator, regulatory protein PadR
MASEVDERVALSRLGGEGFKGAAAFAVVDECGCQPAGAVVAHAARDLFQNMWDAVETRPYPCFMRREWVSVGTFLDRVQIVVDIYRCSMYRASMIAKDLVAASAKPLILGILGEGESYGYEITRKVRELSGGVLEWTDGMLYPVLHRLERQGLVVSEWKRSETGRERKYYRLNSTGRQSLQEERRHWLKVHNTLCKVWKMKTVSI